MTPVQTPADLRPITALRFGAAIWVAVYTYWENLAGAGSSGLVDKGYLGVELFFVLSGFILSHVYLQSAGEKRFSYRGFLWARVARVYPLHVATLVGVGLLAAVALVAGMSVDGNVLSWVSLPANLLMVHAWGLAPVAGWNHPSWSISAEWFAYLCFPLFAFVFWRAREKPVAAVVGTAAFLTVLYYGFERVAGFPLTEATIRWGALRIVPCFALGCALYLVYRKAPLKAPWTASAVSFGLMVLSAALGLWDGITVLLAGALILSLASLPNERAGWLASKPAVYLGEISYSVYMVCVPWKLLAVNLAAKLTDAPDKQLQLFVWLAILALLPVVAALSYHLVEHPARKALRGMAQGRKTASSDKPQDGDTPKRVFQS
ncbi:MAG: acyltransferase [Alphaproteobacteria bacterium]|jgi:peptidoglycan/LPS O-acetylase OafA/YrhL|uniref:Acyltransferase n=1 Tax=Brevundimonas mediterranea TaxID=74329 RepID=A0AB37E6A8_9CAUL|nr:MULTISPECIES: acyltransferase [Brevundimonas]MBU1272705.1 acyltransferase [Alphaproteobacteria bacterium]OGN47403.1 MAG: acyltransferase [Caulobacterales bacterium RIFCSPHIGHO2_12_FULL_68_13]EDX79558.1 putative acyltransferase, putative [Brevundimonas sp. BAL3]MBA4332989.1 acyltransferase [Brevundimonas sp.]MBU1521166.1 acyltransferase [Alphaproteobacteria bacterium]